MYRKRHYYEVVSVVGLIVVLGIALGSDALTTFLRRNSESYPVIIRYWSYSLTALLLAAVTLLLFWFVLNRAPRNVWVAMIYLLTGLFFTAYPILYFIPSITPTLPPLLEYLMTTSRSYNFYAGTFIAMIGLFSLTLPRER
jgi:hypothetical protein